MSKRALLSSIAEKEALRPYHGNIMGLKSNIDAIIQYFPGSRKEFDGKWCAAFVYHCCKQAGFEIPPRYPHKNFGTFAGVKAWLEWAKLSQHGFYHSAKSHCFQPESGDLIIYDYIFDPGPHDHMGIVIEVSENIIKVAEGNVNDISTVIWRKRNHKIRGYIRIPDEYGHSKPT